MRNTLFSPKRIICGHVRKFVMLSFIFWTIYLQDLASNWLYRQNGRYPNGYLLCSFGCIFVFVLLWERLRVVIWLMLICTPSEKLNSITEKGISSQPRVPPLYKKIRWEPSAIMTCDIIGMDQSRDMCFQSLLWFSWRVSSIRRRV